MSAIYKILRRRDKVGRRVLRNKILRTAFEEKRMYPFLDVRYLGEIFKENDCEMTETTIREWIRKGLFGKIKKRKCKWMITKKSLERFMNEMERLDNERYPYTDRYKKPRKKRQSGIKSKRESSLFVQGLVMPNIR